MVSTAMTKGKVRFDPTNPDSVVKTYPREDTERFKCWGSGVRNELVVRRILHDIVPRTLAVWSDDIADYARLEWLDGTQFDVATASDDELIRAGRLLGHLHSCEHDMWGSLGNKFRFATAQEAFTSRFQSAVRLLAERDPALAVEVASWSAPRLAAAPWDGHPTLVHGDFGPTNLICKGARIHVLDWEHARWGHPQEDWAKVRFAARFPEPNGFGTDSTRIQLLEGGWQQATGRRLPTAPQLSELLDVYFAICLSSFFMDESDDRLQWLRRVLRGD